MKHFKCLYAICIVVVLLVVVDLSQSNSAEFVWEIPAIFPGDYSLRGKSGIVPANRRAQYAVRVSLGSGIQFDERFSQVKIESVVFYIRNNSKNKQKTKTDCEYEGSH